MSVHSCNSADDWSTMTDCKVRVDGAWKQCQSIHANVDGAWKKVWPETVFLDPFYPYFASTGNQHTTGTALNQTATLSDLVIRKYTSSSSKGELFPEGTQFRLDQKGLGSGYVIFDLDAEGNVKSTITNSDWTTTSGLSDYELETWVYYGFDADHLGDVAVLTAVDGGAYWWDGTQAVSKVTLTINNLQVLVHTDSAAKTWDNTPLTAGGDVDFCPSEGLGDYAYDFQTTGSITDSGTTTNTYSFAFTTPTVFGDNYTFTENLGKLAVNGSAIIIPDTDIPTPTDPDEHAQALNEKYFSAVSRNGSVVNMLSNVWPGTDILIEGKFDRDAVNTNTLLTLSISSTSSSSPSSVISNIFTITDVSLNAAAGSSYSISDDKQSVTFTGITSNSKVTTRFSITVHNNSADYDMCCGVCLATTTYATVAENAVSAAYYYDSNSPALVDPVTPASL